MLLNKKINIIYKILYLDIDKFLEPVHIIILICVIKL